MKAHKSHTDRRSRLIALVLLCVIAHALVVCLFHHHTSPQTGATGSGPRVASDCTDHREHVPVTGGDSECLSCRLHRSFLSDLRPPLILIDADARAIKTFAASVEPHALALISTLYGRAPPLA